MTAPNRLVGLALALACRGGGAGPPCPDAGACPPGYDTACAIRTCTAGACGLVNAPAGAAAPAWQFAGDCLSVQCDGAGSYAPPAADPSDLPRPTSTCQSNPRCTAQGPSFAVAAMGTPCTSFATGASGVCDAIGSCQQCNQGSDCPAGVTCLNHVCWGNCFDNVLNYSETDVDCGGPQCAPCGPGKTCLASRDCQSAVCDAYVCR